MYLRRRLRNWRKKYFIYRIDEKLNNFCSFSLFLIYQTQKEVMRAVRLQTGAFAVSVKDADHPPCQRKNHEVEMRDNEKL